MKILIDIWNKVFPILKNKYVITVFIFIVWILFFDRNNLLDRANDFKNLKQLKKDKAYYLEQIDKDSKRLEQLRTNNKNLEKFAREQFYMKRDNEDIFVVVESD